MTRRVEVWCGTFYDNILVHVRGHSSSDWPKPNLKFEMNPEQSFRFAAKQAPVEEFNLNTTYSDKAYVRQPLSFETYRDVGAVYSVSFPLRVQLNSEFYGVAIVVEEPDEDYLKR